MLIAVPLMIVPLVFYNAVMLGAEFQPFPG